MNVKTLLLLDVGELQNPNMERMYFVPLLPSLRIQILRVRLLLNWTATTRDVATLAEVDEALAAIDAAAPVPVVLLHCVSDYPAAPEACNLAAMETMSRAFGRPVGWSDHTLGSAVGFAAVTLGAQVIEKHITLDVSMPEASGTRFYKEFKQDPELADTPVVIVTAVVLMGGIALANRTIVEQVIQPMVLGEDPLDRGAGGERPRSDGAGCGRRAPPVGRRGCRPRRFHEASIRPRRRRGGARARCSSSRARRSARGRRVRAGR